MSSPSISYAESVLLHLEKVQELPVDVQTNIARRVDSYIIIARAAKDEAIWQRSLPPPGKTRPRQSDRGATRWTRDGPHRQLPRHGAMPR